MMSQTLVVYVRERAALNSGHCKEHIHDIVY